VIGVLVSGNGSNLQALLDAGLPIGAVASNRKDAYALVRARGAGVPTATFGLDCHAGREERDLVMATWLEEHEVELVVLAGYMHLLTKPFLDRFPDRIVNVHPSLLPAFPGIDAVSQAIAYGVKLFGVTVHFADAGPDTGPVIMQRSVGLPDARELDDVLPHIHAIEHQMLPEVVRLFARGAVRIASTHPRRVLVGPLAVLPERP
jgi:phosphoribosylglycinamide formyltransferase-1